MDASQPLEVEIKLRVPDAAIAAGLLAHAGFRERRARTFERNVVFDTPDLSFRNRGELIRLREFGPDRVLTFKGAAQPGRHKTREEIETQVADSRILEKIFERIGLRPSFRYEKYRTEFSRESEDGVATLDETPIGVFMELEGPAYWIDKVAGELGFSESDYVTQSYGALYSEYCRTHGLEPRDMVFYAAQ